MWIFVGGFLTHLKDKNPAGYYVKRSYKKIKKKLGRSKIREKDL